MVNLKAKIIDEAIRIMNDYVETIAIPFITPMKNLLMKKLGK